MLLLPGGRQALPLKQVILEGMYERNLTVYFPPKKVGVICQGLVHSRYIRFLPSDATITMWRE